MAESVGRGRSGWVVGRRPRPRRRHAARRVGDRRRVAACRAWLGTSTWPAYCAAGVTAGYGLLKAYWVFGGTALWSIAPLPEDVIDEARTHTAPTWFEIADAVTVVLAVAGVVFALATTRPRRWLPVGFVRWTLWPLATLMVLRAVLAIIGEVQQLATGALTGTALWDLVLWSPLFLVWGLLWAGTALTYANRAETAPETKPTAGGGRSGRPHRSSPAPVRRAPVRRSRSTVG